MIPAVFLLGILCALIQNVESEVIVCPREVTGQVDGSVSIICEYSMVTKANKHTRKYFCLEGHVKRCKYTIASTNGYVHQNFADRVFIEDNNKEGLINITFSGLEKTDERTYICGLGTDDKSFKAVFKVIVTEDSVIPIEAKLVYGQLNGAVKFHCEFGDQRAEQRKYLCKIGKTGCRTIIDSSGKMDTTYTGRIILQADEGSPASFTVNMIQMMTEDAGIYFCGVGDYGVGHNIEFDLRVNDETPDIPQRSRSLSTRLGGSVSAQCKYDPKEKYTGKAWCKWEDSACIPFITTDGFVKDGYEGKLVIYDDHINGHMQVVMNQISKAEEGWYWFVLTDGKRDQISAVQIKISEGNPEGLTGGKTIYVKKGETAKMSCYSPCRFNSYEKYWCKWNNFNCTNVTSNVALKENGLSASCYPQQLILTIESASQKDNGWYWCGVKESGIHKDAIAWLLAVEEPRRDVPNSNIRSRVIDSSEDEGSLTPPSDNKHNTPVAAILSVCAVVLIAFAVFFIIRLKRKKNSDLVSVGSYRTNISMTDMDNDIGKENPAVIDTQETDISHSNDGTKIKKKGSQEDLDYSSFLIHHNGPPNEENAA